MSLVNKCIDRLSRRRWEYIRSKWLNHIPDFDAPGTMPKGNVAGISGFDSIALKLAAAAKAESLKAREVFDKSGKYPPPLLQTIDEDLAGVREMVFGESLFLLHKARHVIGTAELQIRDGLHTWSLANAYQGSFFAAKATLGFLGVSFPEFNNKNVVVDLFPHPVKNSDQYSDCAFHFLDTQLSHLPIWEIFQRMLGVSCVEFWPEKIVDKIKAVDTKRFAKQRNHIHYKNTGWIFNDLHDCVVNPKFGNPKEWGEKIDFDSDDITIAMAYSVLRLGTLLLRDLEKSSAKLSPEIKLISDCVEKGRHPLYGSLLARAE